MFLPNLLSLFCWSKSDKLQRCRISLPIYLSSPMQTCCLSPLLCLKSVHHARNPFQLKRKKDTGQISSDFFDNISNILPLIKISKLLRPHSETHKLQTYFSKSRPLHISDATMTFTISHDMGLFTEIQIVKVFAIFQAHLFPSSSEALFKEIYILLMFQTTTTFQQSSLNRLILKPHKFWMLSSSRRI